MASATETSKKTIDKIKSEINTKILKLSDDLFSSVVETTPVATGLLINNWFTATEGYSESTTEIMDKSGQRSISDITLLNEQTNFLEKDSQVSLSNNLSYAYQADSIGWFRTPPYYMVENSIVSIKNKDYK